MKALKLLWLGKNVIAHYEIYIALKNFKVLSQFKMNESIKVTVIGKKCNEEHYKWLWIQRLVCPQHTHPLIGLGS